jgi:hypothetical protein
MINAQKRFAKNVLSFTIIVVELHRHVDGFGQQVQRLGHVDKRAY